MNHALLAAVLATATATLSAQVVEIPAMSTANSTINFSSLPAGNTSLAALVTAGSNGGAPLAAVTLTPNLAQPGLYNTNPELGRALARSATGGLVLVDPLQTFQSFDATIDLTGPCTEFGIAIGDWLGSMQIEFRDRATNTLLAQHLSSRYETANAKFFLVPVEFDRIVLRADNFDGNWVIPRLHLQTAPAWSPFGTGCPGTAGTPSLSLVAAPRIGQVFSLAVSGMQPAGGAFAVAIGQSTTLAGSTPLPFDLGGIGAPGCQLYIDILGYLVLTHTTGSGQYDFPIPNDTNLVGAPVANQATVFDPPANPLGLVFSNAGSGTVR